MTIRSRLSVARSTGALTPFLACTPPSIFLLTSIFVIELQLRHRLKPSKPNDSVDGPEGWNKIQGAFWREGFIGSDFHMEEVTPRLAAETVNLIRKYAATEKQKPLFCYLALPSPHTPWLPLEKYRGKSGAGMYGDFVMQVDGVIGQVMSALDETKLADNTLIFFSSDNGPVWYDKDTERFHHSSTGGLRGMKFSPWEGGHRMPFIARWPAKIKAGSTSEQTIIFSDLFATLAELVDAKKIPKDSGEGQRQFSVSSTRPERSRLLVARRLFTTRELLETVTGN